MLYTLQGQEKPIQLRNFAYLFPIIKGYILTTFQQHLRK